jgi:hypothetical protein
MTTSPKLFYINHPLTEINTVSDEVAATFTDEQISEYSALYDEYLTAQRQAASWGADTARKLRDLITALFQDPLDKYNLSKQRKYFDRMIRNGETVVDLHANKYPKPSVVTSRVEKARERVASIESNRAPASSESTLREINNAVSYLLKQDFVLNTDFTISNAVNIAKQHARDIVVRRAEHNPGEEATFDGYRLVVASEELDSSNIRVIAPRTSWNDSDLNVKFLSASDRELLGSKFPKFNKTLKGGVMPLIRSFSVSFEDSDVPTIVIQ